jgi:2-polyprenyl-6-methoxyphenol hydroxylase-like FAD-dependent oxidoreductase
MSTGSPAEHAVILGGSIAGLVAARVLSDHFTRVTIVERDRIRDGEGARKGVPQGRHVHGILAKGIATLERLFPGIRQQLLEDGATPLDMGANLHWYHFGGYKVRFESGLIALGMTRPFLEAHVRARVLALPEIELRDETEVEGWLLDDAKRRVVGVSLRPRTEGAAPEQLHADLVVDCTGRGSRTPRWLEEAGFDRPPEEAVKVDVGYATRLYELASDEPMRGQGIMIYPLPPGERRMGAMFPIEGKRWILSLGGWGGDHAPVDEAGFHAFAESLPTKDIIEIMSRSRPIGDIVLHKFPSNLRRRYERSTRIPARLVVLGDAVCSFNPIYGQGMTLAILQAEVLGEILAAHAHDLDALPRRFLHAAAKALEVPWQMATGEDFRFPTTTGRKRPGTDVMNWFAGQANIAALRDPMVHHAFLRVMNMLEPPTALFKPKLLWKILAGTQAAR